MNTKSFDSCPSAVHYKSSYCKWFAIRGICVCFLVNMDRAIFNLALQLSPNLARKWERNADRIGVFASVLCAIHCVATPFLLLLFPTFGKVWSHPASHWGMALVVVPIAALPQSKVGKARGSSVRKMEGANPLFFHLCESVCICGSSSKRRGFLTRMKKNIRECSRIVGNR